MRSGARLRLAITLSCVLEAGGVFSGSPKLLAGACRLKRCCPAIRLENDRMSKSVDLQLCPIGI